jgi:hypothetical protein
LDAVFRAAFLDLDDGIRFISILLEKLLNSYARIGLGMGSCLRLAL